MYFISGEGSNLKSLINNSKVIISVKINLVISNNANAKGILLAKKNSIPFIIIDTKEDAENFILANLKKYKISLICLAGYMVFQKVLKFIW